jgi:hypothetical protein
MSQNHD